MTMQELTAAPRSGNTSQGTWFRNPVTGETALITVEPDEDGRHLEAQLWLQPDAAVMGAHVHDNIVESFEILEGEVAFRLDDRERTARPGDGPVVIPAGTVHDWWNSGSAVARVRVVVDAVESAPGRPAARFLDMIKAMWSLGALGRTDADGMPGPLWLAAVGSEYRDVVRFTSPPAFVQAALFGPVAWTARLLGRNPHAPELGIRAACAMR